MAFFISLLIVPICGFLWSLGGAKGYSLGWRRVGIPIFLLYVVSAMSRTWIVPSISMLLLYISTTLPYGIPSDNDKGGLIGRFFYRIYKCVELCSCWRGGRAWGDCEG